MSEISFNFTIGDTGFPAETFSVTGGVFGSVGHVTAVTSITMLRELKIDLYKLASEASEPLEINVTVTIDKKEPVRIFGGEYVNATWHYDRDTVEIHCRDWAGQLVDQKRILTKIASTVTKVLAPLVPGANPAASGVSNVNQSLSDIVTAIANEFSMTPVLHLNGPVSGSTKIGTLYGTDDQTYLPVPQSLWEILNQLARDTGYVVYVTPKKELVFGEPGAGVETLNLSWNTNPVPADYVPFRFATIEHHPRRNSTFRVMVFSYDPGKGQQTTGYATVVGSNMAGSAKMKPGIWSGQDAVTANKQLANAKVGGYRASQVPLYSFRLDGLTQDQATQRALTIATDISKRELILSGQIDGQLVTPTQKIKLSGPVNPAFSGNTFYMNGFTHHYRITGGRSRGGSERTGFTTDIKALDIPTMGTAGSGPLL